MRAKLKERETDSDRDRDWKQSVKRNRRKGIKERVTETDTKVEKREWIEKRNNDETSLELQETLINIDYALHHFADPVSLPRPLRRAGDRDGGDANSEPFTHHLDENNILNWVYILW